MNWFLIGAGLLYVLGSAKSAQEGEWKMAGVLICYALANVLLALIKEAKWKVTSSLFCGGVSKSDCGSSPRSAVGQTGRVKSSSIRGMTSLAPVSTKQFIVCGETWPSKKSWRRRSKWPVWWPITTGSASWTSFTWKWTEGKVMVFKKFHTKHHIWYAIGFKRKGVSREKKDNRRRQTTTSRQ